MLRRAAFAFVLALSACQATTPTPTPSPTPTSTPRPTTRLPSTANTPLPTLTPSAHPSPVAGDGPLLVAAALGHGETFEIRVVAYQPMADGSLREDESWTGKIFHPEDTEGAYGALVARPRSDEVLVNVRGFRSWLWSLSHEPDPVALPEPLFYSTDLRWSLDGQWLAGHPGSGGAAVAIWNPSTDETRMISPTSGELANFPGSGSVPGWTTVGDAPALFEAAARCFDSASFRAVRVATGEAFSIVDRRIDVAEAVGPCGDLYHSPTVSRPGEALVSSARLSIDGTEAYVVGSLDGTPHLWVIDPDLRVIADDPLPAQISVIRDITEDARWLIGSAALEFSACPSNWVVDRATGASWPIPCSVGPANEEGFLYPSFAWLDQRDQP